MKKVFCVSEKKEQIIIIACANALGKCLLPMVIFEKKYLNHQWTFGEVLDTYYGMSDKSWTLRHWLKNHFLRYAVPGRPILLEGHSSHYEQEVLSSPMKKIYSYCVYHLIQYRILDHFTEQCLDHYNIIGQVSVINNNSAIL